MPLIENFAIYTDPQFGGKVGLYTAAGSSSSVEVNGSFWRPGDDILGVEGSEPLFGCALADVPNASHGDTLVVDDVAYVVRGVKRDGTGWVDLKLELA